MGGLLVDEIRVDEIRGVFPFSRTKMAAAGSGSALSELANRCKGKEGAYPRFPFR